MTVAKAPSRRGRLAAALLLASLAAWSCGYRLVGKGGTFPEGVARVAVPPFKNTTTKPGLETELAAVLSRKVLETGKVSLAEAGEGDATFRGSITAYLNKALAYNAQGDITERRVTVTATVEFLVRGKEEPLFSQAGVTGKGEYRVSGSLAVDASREKEALREAVEELADKVVSLVMEGF